MTLVKCVEMNRDDDPYVLYYGMWRRTARKSVGTEMMGRRLNPDPVYPPPEPEPPAHPVPEYHFEPINNPDYSTESDPEPEYHPGPEYPDDIYDPEPVNVYVADPMPGSPAGSTHSSVGDNFDYPGIREADEEEADPDDLLYVLDDNTILTQALYLDYQHAGQISETTQEKYLMFLSRVKNYHKLNGQFRHPHPPEDWILSTLHHFPHTRFWVRKINDLLEEGPIDDVKPYLRYLKYMVRQHM